MMHHLTFCGTRTSGPWWPMTPDDDNHLSMKLSGLLEMSHARLRAQEMEQGWASPGQKHRLLGELLPQLRGRRVSVQEAVDVVRPTLQETGGEHACAEFYANNYNPRSNECTCSNEPQTPWVRPSCPPRCPAAPQPAVRFPYSSGIVTVIKTRGSVSKYQL